MIELFPRSIDTGSRFGTVTLRLNERGDSDLDVMFEATTLRVEGSYGDGRRPDEVSFGSSLKSDLQRRDLTMNAIAVDVARRLLHDPFEGRKDLEEGVVRAVGSASDRLREDGLRIMRAYRFMDAGSRGLLTADESLSIALIERQDCIKNVSVERIWGELKRILVAPHAAAVVRFMQDDGLLECILGPNLAPASDLNLDISSFGEVNELDVLRSRLAVIVSPLEESEQESRMRNLTVPRNLMRNVIQINKTITRLPSIDSVRELRLFRTAAGNLLPSLLLALGGQDENSAQGLKEALENLPLLRAGISPLVDGVVLAKATGLDSGIRLGRLKSWLHRCQIEDDLAVVSDVLTLLDELDWKVGNPSEWPQVQWP
jgi:tRNA nucleotidyltransferase/poly(A) polymerase